jgi:hypothetical protein
MKQIPYYNIETKIQQSKKERRKKQLEKGNLNEALYRKSPLHV